MRIFLSWSGEKSHEVALVLKHWLPEIINDLDPWMSSEDIEKGAAWSATIAEQLEESNFGIICLTRENRDRVWLNYEAGAIAKAMYKGNPKGRAATFLIDIEQESEVTGPLAQFQHTRPNRPDVLKLVYSLNTAAGSLRTTEQLERAVAKWWPDLEAEIIRVNAQPRSITEKPIRLDRELLEEILLRVRDIAADMIAIQHTAIAPPSPRYIDRDLQAAAEIAKFVVHLKEMVERAGGPNFEWNVEDEELVIFTGDPMPAEYRKLAVDYAKRSGRKIRLVTPRSAYFNDLAALNRAVDVPPDNSSP